MKQKFLIVYDYGMGGVWAVISARSEGEILAKYPKVDVMRVRPSWMTEAQYNRIEEVHSFDIDDAPQGWLSSMHS